MQEQLFGKDKTEYKNGIWKNDPLNLMITIDLKNGIKIGVENASLTIEPSNHMMAFSNKKIGLRSSNPKNKEQLRKKLSNMFKKTKQVVKAELEKGSLDVHGEEIVNIIKSKV